MVEMADTINSRLSEEKVVKIIKKNLTPFVWEMNDFEQAQTIRELLIIARSVREKEERTQRYRQKLKKMESKRPSETVLSGMIISSGRARLPYVPLQCGSVRTTGLTDTGSQASFVSEDLFKKLCSSNYTQIKTTVPLNWKSATGNLASSTKAISVIFRMPGSGGYKWLFYVAENLPAPMVLGMDFMEHYRLVVRTDLNCLTRGNKKTFLVGTRRKDAPKIPDTKEFKPEPEETIPKVVGITTNVDRKKVRFAESSERVSKPKDNPLVKEKSSANNVFKKINSKNNFKKTNAKIVNRNNVKIETIKDSPIKINKKKDDEEEGYDPKWLLKSPIFYETGEGQMFLEYSNGEISIDRLIGN